MRTFFIFLLCLCTAVIANGSLGTLQDRQGDKSEVDGIAQKTGDQNIDKIVTKRLYNQYVNTGNRIQTAEVDAAIELVGARAGGDLAFRQAVLATYVKSFEVNEGERFSATRSRRLLKVISKFLHRGGLERWRDSSTEGVQMFYRNMTREELAAEAKMLAAVIDKSDKFDFLQSVIAVREAHHPEGKKFLSDVIGREQHNERNVSDGSKGYLAAVGLAELGEASGVEWLLKHANFKNNSVRYAHFYSTHDTLGENCRLALADLFGLEGIDEHNVSELESFWNKNKSKFEPCGVNLKL